MRKLVVFLAALLIGHSAQAALAVSPGVEAKGQRGQTVISATSPNALAVGQNGSINPAFTVNTNSAFNQQAGLVLTGAINGGNVSLKTSSPSSTEGLNIFTSGAGNLVAGTTSSGSVILQLNGANEYTFAQGTFTMVPKPFSSGAASHFVFTGAADTALTASSDVNIEFWNNAAAIRQHATGALAASDDFFVNGATDSFVGASTLTMGSTMRIAPKSCGTNGTCTTETALWIPSAAITGTVTTGYGAVIAAPTGATNNYAANFAGDVTFTGSAPTISSCGSGAAASGSSDHKGQITGITAATACTITFAQALATAPACTFSSNAAIVPTISSISTSAVTTTMAALTGTIYYICF